MNYTTIYELYYYLSIVPLLINVTSLLYINILNSILTLVF